MTIDIVGTSSQTFFALLSLCAGLVVGLLGFLLNRILCKTKVRIFFADFFSTLILGVTGIIFCLHFLNGVFFLYVFFCEIIGYILSFFLIKVFWCKLKNVFKKSNK